LLSWFARNVDFHGSVFFRGALPPRPEYFSFLAQQGVTVRQTESPANAHWRLELDHPEWGRASMAAFRDVAMPPGILLELDPRLD
jgi:hypothetical protein